MADSSDVLKDFWKQAETQVASVNGQIDKTISFYISAMTALSGWLATHPQQYAWALVLVLGVFGVVHSIYLYYRMDYLHRRATRLSNALHLRSGLLPEENLRCDSDQRRCGNRLNGALLNAFLIVLVAVLYSVALAFIRSAMNKA